MKRALLTWLGTADVNALTAAEQTNPGPLKQVISEKGFDTVYIMSNRKHELTKQCVDILKKWNKRLKIEIFQYDFTDPTDYELVLQCTQKTLVEILPKVEYTKGALTFFATPGTPIMVAVFLLMAERLPQVSLIQSTIEHGVKYVKWSLPVYLSPEKVAKIVEDTSEEIPDYQFFRDLVFSSEIMREKTSQALRYAHVNIPVLILGETGTGKEEFARRIHKASHRTGDFIAVNCGAIPDNLIESELFGTSRNAYTGASDQPGKFELADSGTIFLDEIGELPLKQQVKLLRVIQEKSNTRVGPQNKSRKLDVRIIAATNRNLAQMVREGTFREDLFYRLAIAVITLPPLRERGQDILLAADAALTMANMQIYGKVQKDYKEFSNDVKLFISSQEWPGNFREINSVVLRAVLNSSGKTLTVSDIQEAMLDMGGDNRGEGCSFELPPYTSDGSFKLDDALKAVEKHYIELALRDANHKKTKAAQLLGIDNYQILTPRMKEYGL